MKYNIPDIIHLHGSEFEKWYHNSNDRTRKYIRILLRECKRFIVLGNKWNKIVKEIEPETNTLVLGNTVHIPKYTVHWDQPFKILYMGVLIERKGVRDLLHAVKLIKKEDVSEHIRLVIAGSGEEESNLKKICKDLGLDHVVEFAGWIAEEKKETLFRECQMLVLPSYNEGLPIAILEAISYGMPIVATNVGDVSSAVNDGNNGFLFEPGDVNQLACALSKISGDKQVYERMATNSKMIANKFFSDNLYFEKLKTIYTVP